jgi:hypothetical protein
MRINTPTVTASDKCGPKFQASPNSFPELGENSPPMERKKKRRHRIKILLPLMGALLTVVFADSEVARARVAVIQMDSGQHLEHETEFAGGSDDIVARDLLCPVQSVLIENQRIARLRIGVLAFPPMLGTKSSSRYL